MVDYLSCLKVQGEFHSVGIPDAPLPKIKTQAFLSIGRKIGGRHIGSRPEMLAMLKLASEKEIKPMVETVQIWEQGCGEAAGRVYKNDVRYRLTLVGYEKAFGK